MDHKFKLEHLWNSFCRFRNNLHVSRLINIHYTSLSRHSSTSKCVWNVISHIQKPDFVFRRNGRVHLYRRERPFSRLLAADVCVSAIVMLDTQRSEIVWRVLATHFFRQFPLRIHSRASPCAITFQLVSTKNSPCFAASSHSSYSFTFNFYFLQYRL